MHATYCTSCSSQGIFLLCSIPCAYSLLQIQLLEAIGALTPMEAKKAASDESDGAYQDSVADPLGPLPDDESAEQFEHLDTETEATAIKTAVGKVCTHTINVY